MKAVNLIPLEERRGGGSGAGAYAVLGALGVAFVAMTLFVLASNQIADSRAELSSTRQRTAAMQTQIDALKPYVEFAKLKENRLLTVRSLAASRFDWPQVMQDLSRVTTSQVWLQTLTGTVAPGVTVEGGASGASSFRAALPNPALEMEACATSNKAVVAFVARLRAMKGVQRVTLSDATKSDTAAPVQAGAAGTSGTSSPASAGGCSSSDRWPDFNVVVFYAGLASVTATPAVSGSTSSSSTTTSTSASSSPTTPPASSSSSAPPAAPVSTGGTP